MKADDLHPNRPTHPDFAHLSQVVNDMDDRAEKPGFDTTTDVSSLVDADSMVYVATDRVRTFTRELAAVGLRPAAITEPLAMATWVDGFVAGATFAKRVGR